MLLWCSTALAAPEKTLPVCVITLERDGFGAAAGSRLELRSDGRAIHTITGNARRGTEDRLSYGTISRDDFRRLLQMARTQGFFQLEERYEPTGDEALQDGAWSTLTITADGQERQVFRRENAGPPWLNELEGAIDALQRRTPFKPTP